MKAHSYADLFPMMNDSEFKELKKDIKENGFLPDQQILVYDDKILDGRNRYKACKELGIEPQLKEWKGKNALQYVISTNVHRRHMNESQRAMVGSKIANLSLGDNQHTASAHMPTQKEVSQMLNIGERNLRIAKEITKKRPEAVKEIEFGKLKLGAVYREIKLEEQEKQIEKLIPEKEIEGVYDIIVMDPPWNYGREYDPENSRVASPYPEMNQAKLKEIKIPANKDSILFLWTTHQFIWEAKELLSEWGFEYKAIIVWDKEKMGMGSWLRMQCEFCLVGVKGKPLWKAKDIRDIIREARTKHSKKPESFYNMIEDKFAGRKLDYFARMAREGWDVYGDEIKRRLKCSE